MRPLASPSSSMPMLAAAVVSLFTLQQFRLFVSGLAFTLREARGLGPEVAGLIGLVVVSLALLGVLLVADMNRSMVLVLVVSACLARLVTQIAGDPLVLVGVSGLGVVLGALALLSVALVLGGRETGAGIVLGGAADVALMTVRHTLDLPHSSSLGGLLITLALAGLGMGTVLGERQIAGIRRHGPIPASALFAVGGWMAIHLTYTGNLGFISSVTGSGLLISAAVAAGSLVLVLAWAAPGQAAPHPALSALAAAAALVAVANADGGLGGFLVSVAAIGAGVTVATAFDRESTGSRDRSAWGCALGLIAGYIAVLAPYLPQGGLELVPTGVNALVAMPLIGAGIGAVVTQSGVVTPWRSPVLIATGLAVVAVGGGLLSPPPETEQIAGDPFVMTFNLHSGIGLDGALDLESMARIVESTDPDIVALQEVSRGLVATGGVDMVIWLEQRLGLPVRFAPSLTRQWGVALASRLPSETPAVMSLGVLSNGVQRVVLDVPVRTAVGQVRVLVTQLDEEGQVSDDLRQRQIDDLVVAWGGSTNAVIAGDLGATLDDPIPLSLRVAGLDNAGRYASEPVLTYPSRSPTGQHDYIFVGGALGISSIRVLEHVASDHLAVQTRVGATGVRQPDDGDGEQ